jgi:E3 ubiquitin-protein ligase UBR4
LRIYARSVNNILEKSTTPAHPESDHYFSCVLKAAGETMEVFYESDSPRTTVVDWFRFCFFSSKQSLTDAALSFLRGLLGLKRMYHLSLVESNPILKSSLWVSLVEVIKKLGETQPSRLLLPLMRSLLYFGAIYKHNDGAFPALLKSYCQLFYNWTEAAEKSPYSLYCAEELLSLFRELVSLVGASTEPFAGHKRRKVVGGGEGLFTCTYAQTGSKFTEQCWYHCYTCNLQQYEGCCVVCVKVCHSGHDVAFARKSSFYCDCNASETCRALNAVPADLLQQCREFKADGLPVRSFSCHTEDFMKSDYVEDHVEDALCLGEDWREAIKGAKATCLKILLEGSFLTTAIDLLCCYIRCDSKQSKGKALRKPLNFFPSGNENYVEVSMRTPRNFLEEVPVKSEELLNALNNRVVSRVILQSVELEGVHYFLCASGQNVHVISATQSFLLSKFLISERNKALVVSSATFSSEIFSIVPNAAHCYYFAVCGLTDVAVFTLNSEGKIVSKLPISLGMQEFEGGVKVVKVIWLPNSQTRIAVITTNFVKVYELLKDNISPINCYCVCDNHVIVNCIFFVGDETNEFFICTETSQSSLYISKLTKMEEDDATSSVGRQSLVEDASYMILLENSYFLGYSTFLKKLLLFYYDGSIGAIDFRSGGAPSSKIVGGVNKDKIFYDTESDKIAYFYELQTFPELIVLMKYGSPELLFVDISSGDQSSSTSVYLKSNVEGICELTYSSRDPYNFSLYALSTDGAISRVQFSAPLKQFLKHLTNNNELHLLLSNHYLYKENYLPFDFFERATDLTNEVRFIGNDILQNYTVQMAYERLSKEKEFITAPSPNGFTITILILNPFTKITGVVLRLGENHLLHIPKYVKFLDRKYYFRNEMRCYPIPFTLEEALSIGSEFDLFFSECFDPSKLPIIDSIQVYGIPARELQTLNTKFFDSGKFTSLEQFCSECCALFSHLYFSSSRAETQYQEDGQWNIIESTIAQLLMKGVPVYVEKILKSTYV